MFPLSLDYSLLVSVFRVPNVSLVIRLFIVVYVFRVPNVSLVIILFIVVSVFRVPNVSLVIRLFIVGLCVSCTKCFTCH